MDLKKLMRYYHNCPSFGGITVTIDGAIVPAPEGALREGTHRLAGGAEPHSNPQVVPPGTSVVLNTGAGCNQGYDPEKSGTQVISSSDGKTWGFHYRSWEVPFTGPVTAREVLQQLAAEVAWECGRNNLLQDFLTGSDYYLDKVSETVTTWPHDADTSDDEHEQVAAAAAAGDEGVRYGSRRAPPWRPPHWRTITEEERAPFVNYNPKARGPNAPEAPVLEFAADPLEGMSTNKLFVAGREVCQTCALVGFELTDTWPGPGGTLHEYKAIWSAPFC